MDWSAVGSGVVVGLFSGIGTSLLSARVVPLFQHQYWQQQRMFEARSATAKELKRLHAEYLAGHIAKDTGQEPGWMPPREFWIAWHAMQTEVATLFSVKARAAVKDVEALMTAQGGIGSRADRPPKTEADYIRAGNAAMRPLYEEIGLRLPPA